MVTGLTSGDITVADATGAATTGSLTGSGTAWSIALTDVATQGNVSVSIAKSGIESGVKTVAVYKAGGGGDGGSSGSLQISGIPGSGTRAVYVFNSGTDISTYAGVVAAITALSYQAVGASGTETNTFALYGWNGSTQGETFTRTGSFPVLLLKTDGSITDATNPMYCWAQVSFTTGGGSTSFDSFTPIVAGSLTISGLLTADTAGTRSLYVFSNSTDISTYAKAMAASIGTDYRAMGATLPTEAADVFILIEQTSIYFAENGSFKVLLMNLTGSATNAANPMFSWASVSFTKGVGTAAYSDFTPLLDTKDVRIAITFAESAGEITVTGGGTISQGSNGSFTITVTDAEDYSDFRWIADGVTQSSQSDSMWVYADYWSVGPHRITVIADKDAIPYSAEVAFTVTN
jgi:hypothetical protein